MRPQHGAEAIGVLSLSIAAAVLLTYPLAFKLGQVGRIEVGDGQWSIWVIAWVARTLLTDPRHLFDANIFYPHRNTLAFSETNLGGGVLGAPIYALTRDPYATHNFVVLASFVLAATGMYYLCRRLTGYRGAAAVGAVTFAFSPYVFARTAHIQLMLTAGLPFSMLAFHRLLDQPSLARALILSLALVLQTMACGYYGVFAALMISFGVLYFASARGLWRDRRFWTAIALAGLVSLMMGMMIYLPYLRLESETGFSRTLDDARRSSADWRAYLVSNAWAHRWMLSLVKHWKEVLFPGFMAAALGLTAIGLALARKRALPRDTIFFYASVAVLACWASFGPAAGLYTALYSMVPMFSLMRAPGRFGMLVVFSLSVLAAFAVAALVGGSTSAEAAGGGQTRRRAHWVAAVLTVCAVAELALIPMDWREVPPLPSPYRILAKLPRGPVLELPFFYRPMDFWRHSRYMLNSTHHWQPLVNGYSDYIPDDFRDMAVLVSSFPARDSFKRLEPIAPRYAVFHMNLYDRINRTRVEQRLKEFAPYLRPLAQEGDVRLYEIIGWPP